MSQCGPFFELWCQQNQVVKPIANRSIPSWDLKDPHLVESMSQGGPFFELWCQQNQVVKPIANRSIPSWDLSLVLMSLTKAPFEPLKVASLKILAFKTVFLMALASGKRRGEVHAWTYSSLRHKTSVEGGHYFSSCLLSKESVGF